MLYPTVTFFCEDGTCEELEPDSVILVDEVFTAENVNIAQASAIANVKLSQEGWHCGEVKRDQGCWNVVLKRDKVKETVRIGILKPLDDVNSSVIALMGASAVKSEWLAGDLSQIWKEPEQVASEALKKTSSSRAHLQMYATRMRYQPPIEYKCKVGQSSPSVPVVEFGGRQYRGDKQSTNVYDHIMRVHGVPIMRWEDEIGPLIFRPHIYEGGPPHRKEWYGKVSVSGITYEVMALVRRSARELLAFLAVYDQRRDFIDINLIRAAFSQASPLAELLGNGARVIQRGQLTPAEICDLEAPSDLLSQLFQMSVTTVVGLPFRRISSHEGQISNSLVRPGISWPKADPLEDA